MNHDSMTRRQRRQLSRKRSPLLLSVMLMARSKQRIVSAAASSGSRASLPTPTSTMMATTTTASKDFFILRHGQATHNPRAEVAKANGCSFDDFLELMRQDDSLDSELTVTGQAQAQAVFETNRNNKHFRQLDLVVSSPLSRALQTADLAAPGHLHSNRICYEEFREINGYLLNAKRRSLSAIRQIFPSWNLDYLEHEEDVLWTPKLESNEACRERGYQGLQWILQRPEKKILLVAHGGILRYTMTEHPNVLVKDARRQSAVDNNNDDGDTTIRPVDARFDNCELRRYQIQWGTSEEDGSQTQEVVLTEVDLDHEQAIQSEVDDVKQDTEDAASSS